MFQFQNTEIVKSKISELSKTQGKIIGVCPGLGCLLRKNGRYVGEVTRVKNKDVMFTPFTTDGLHVGDWLEIDDHGQYLRPCKSWLGKVLDPFGLPLCKDTVLEEGPDAYSIYRHAPAALRRARITRPFNTGIKSINAFTPLMYGQRIGLFAGAGQGKSSLLGMLLRHSSSDVNIVILVGERGREVREFIEDVLQDSISKSIVVVSTSDQPCGLRIRCVYSALAIAEYFRDQGLQVLCAVDSITRFCMAAREVDLSSGEVPTTKGYTAGTFARLAQVLERMGPCDGNGTITGLATVLVEGNDMDDPVADACKSTLDGHILLSNDLAERGIYPAIHVGKSISRLPPDDTEHTKQANQARSLLAAYQDIEPLVNMGLYKQGTREETDKAIRFYSYFLDFLKQERTVAYSIEESINMLAKVLEQTNMPVQQHSNAI